MLAVTREAAAAAFNEPVGRIAAAHFKPGGGKKVEPKLFSYIFFFPPRNLSISSLSAESIFMTRISDGEFWPCSKRPCFFFLGCRAFRTVVLNLF